MDKLPIWEIIVNVLEVGAIVSFLSMQLKIEKNKRHFIFLGYVFALVIITGINYIDIQLSFDIVGAITIYVTRIISFGVFFTFSLLILMGSTSEKVLWACLPPLIMSLSDFISFQIMRITTDGTLEEVAELGRGRFFTTLIYLLVSVFTYTCIILYQRKKERANILLLAHFRALLIFIMVLGTVAIDQLIDITFFAGGLSDYVMEVKSLFISISFFVILLSVFLLMQQMGKMTLDLLQAQHDKIVYKNYEELARSYNELRTAKHDINNHLNTLNGLYTAKNYAALGKYLKDVTNEYAASQAVLTSNMPLDVLLANKMAAAKENNIEFRFKAMDIEKLSTPYSALCSIVGNLLDNAIEACKRLPEGVARKIQVEMIKKEQMLNIYVENSADGRYKRQGDIFLSSKSGPLNGMGLKICDAAVKRLGGFIYIDARKDSFQVAITLPFDAFNKGDVDCNEERSDY